MCVSDSNDGCLMSTTNTLIFDIMVKKTRLKVATGINGGGGVI